MGDQVIVEPFDLEVKRWRLKGNKYQCKCSSNDTVVIVCHPYKPLGGSMSDHVVVDVSYWYANHGATAITFNFNSGRFWGASFTGLDEVDQLNTMVEHVFNHLKPSRLVLCGYSYGGLIVSLYSQHMKDRWLVRTDIVLISPVIGVISRFLTAFCHKTPPLSAIVDSVKSSSDKAFVMLIYGTNDQFTSSNAYTTYTRDFNTLNVHLRLNTVAGADHFWAEETYSPTKFLQ